MSPQQNEQILIGRAKNALLSFFEQRLSVPKIYLDADWEGEKIDVLAIDRAGVGDVSVALTMPGEISLSDLIKKLHGIPAHFKYLISVRNVLIGRENRQNTEEDVQSWQLKRADRLQRTDDPMLFAHDGVGRIGQIFVDLARGRPVVTVPTPAERFRSNQHIYDLAENFSSSHTADFEIRI